MHQGDSANVHHPSLPIVVPFIPPDSVLLLLEFYSFSPSAHHALAHCLHVQVYSLFLSVHFPMKLCSHIFYNPSLCLTRWLLKCFYAIRKPRSTRNLLVLHSSSFYGPIPHNLIFVAHLPCPNSSTFPTLNGTLVRTSTGPR